jgi:predicted amidohydrolase YtcJ
MRAPIDLIITNADVHTCDPRRSRAEAVAVSRGAISAVGTAAEIADLRTAATEVVDVGGRMLMPGLVDIHAHLLTGGTAVAWELTLQPDETLDDILAAVRRHAQTTAADEWIVGGAIGSPVVDQLAQGGFLAALDDAASGRPVLLRDQSYHNRWVNSRALQLMGVGRDTPDPHGGTFVRTKDGELTGVLYEAASTLVERAAAMSTGDAEFRDRVAVRTAIELMNSFGVTAIQDAATLDPALRALSSLDDHGELTAWVVASLPARPWVIDGTVGPELYAAAERYRRSHVRPDFAKIFLDGVPMTRSSALLEPYISHGRHEDPADAGPLFWSDDDLVAELERCHALGLGAKIHATGDRSVRQALDAFAVMRRRHGPDPIFHIAHVEYVAPTDVPRFAALGVIADASPYIWFPTAFDTSIENQVPPSILRRAWPLRELLDHHAVVAAGSDWPIVPTPDPWNALQALLTRSNPGASVAGRTNPGGAISLPEAIAAFTSSSAGAIGMPAMIGALAPGRSADFIVLDQNLFDIETSAIHRTAVLQTYFRGRRVYGSEF